jgi:hypothetical protein
MSATAALFTVRKISPLTKPRQHFLCDRSSDDKVLTKIGLTTIFVDAKNPRINNRIVSVQRRGALLGGGITRIFYQSHPILLRRLASYVDAVLKFASPRLHHADRLAGWSASLTQH